MAKKGTSKKQTKQSKTPNTKLRRQIRLTLASVLLVTAVVVALVPPGVLEANPISIPEDASPQRLEDLRAVVSYPLAEGTPAVGPNILDRPAYPSLLPLGDRYRSDRLYLLPRPVGIPNLAQDSDDLEEPTGGDNIAYTIRARPNGYNFISQFEFKILDIQGPTTHPANGGVVITRYLNIDPDPVVDLSGETLNTGFYLVSTKTFDEFFDSDNESGGGREYSYGYDNFVPSEGDAVANSNAVTDPRVVLRKFWSDDYAAIRLDYSEYERYLGLYNNWVTGGRAGDPPQKPDARHRIVYAEDGPDAGIKPLEPVHRLTVQPSDLGDVAKQRYYCFVAERFGAEDLTDAGIAPMPTGAAGHRLEVIRFAMEPDNKYKAPTSTENGFTRNEDCYIAIKNPDYRTEPDFSITNPSGPEPGGFGWLTVGTNDFLVTAGGPAELRGIADRAFAGLRNVGNLRLPETLNYIGDSAFEGNTYITNIDLTWVAFIGNRAFMNSTLETVDFVTHISAGRSQSAVENIGTEAFKSSAITEITFPGTLMRIGDGAFAECNSLRNVDMGLMSGVDIGKYAFYGNAAMDTPKNMGDNAFRRIGEAAFAIAPNTTPGLFAEISLPANIGNMALPADDGNYTHYFRQTYYNTPALLGDLLFAGRRSLRTVVLPEMYGTNSSVTIPSGMFRDCAGLRLLQLGSPSRDNDHGHRVSFMDTETALYDDDDNDEDTNPVLVAVPDGAEVNGGGYIFFPGPDPEPELEDWTYNGELKPYTGSWLFNEVFVPEGDAEDYFVVFGPERTDFPIRNSEAWPRRSSWAAWQGNPANPVTYRYISLTGVDTYEVASWENNYILRIAKGEEDDEGILIGASKIDDRDTGVVVIPPRAGPFYIRELGTGSLNDLYGMEALIIPDGTVRTLGSNLVNSGQGFTRLRYVEIGDSVTSIGANAFASAPLLRNVYFNPPADEKFEGHLTIGQGAFQTGGEMLTFHGEIDSSYGPYSYATNPASFVHENIRILYRSLPTSTQPFLAVMHDPGQGLRVLLEYPRYAALDERINTSARIENPGQRGDYLAGPDASDGYIDYWTTLYQGDYAEDSDAAYPGKTVADARAAFATAYDLAASLTGDAQQAALDALYQGENYGPWVSEDWLTFDPGPDPDPDPPVSPPTSPGAKAWRYSVTGNNELTREVPRGNFEQNNYQENQWIRAALELDIPPGIESIDARAFFNNPTNNAQWWYFDPDPAGTWPTPPAICLDAELPTPDGPHGYITKAVGGLFSGYYPDGGARKGALRGDNHIRSISMADVKFLPDYAFDSCEALERVSFNEKLTDIGTQPFRGATMMISLEMGDNTKYKIENGIIYSSKNDDGIYETIEQCLPSRGNAGILAAAVLPDHDPAVYGLLANSRVEVTVNDPLLQGVDMIKDAAFEECIWLRQVDLRGNNAISRIPKNAFRFVAANPAELPLNASLEVWLPASVGELDEGSFWMDGALNIRVWHPNPSFYAPPVPPTTSDLNRNTFKNDSLNNKLEAVGDSMIYVQMKRIEEYNNGLFWEVSAIAEMIQVRFHDGVYPGHPGSTLYVVDVLEGTMGLAVLLDIDFSFYDEYLAGLDPQREFVAWNPVIDEKTQINKDGIPWIFTAETRTVIPEGVYYSVDFYHSADDIGREGVDFFPNTVPAGGTLEYPAALEKPGQSIAAWNVSPTIWRTGGSGVFEDYQIAPIYTTDPDNPDNPDRAFVSVSFYDTVAKTLLDPDGKPTTSPQRVRVGERPDIPYPAPSHEGWEFRGWAPNESIRVTTAADVARGISIFTDFQRSSPLDPEAGTHSVTVVRGITADGRSRYTPGETVRIRAIAPAQGQVFDRWTSFSNGMGSDNILDAYAPDTVFTMPGNDVIVTATYRNNLAPGPGGGGGGGGATPAPAAPSPGSGSGGGNARVEISLPGIPSHALASATVTGAEGNFVIRVSEDTAAYADVAAALRSRHGEDISHLAFTAMDITLYDATGTYPVTDTSGLSISLTLPLPTSQVTYGGANRVISARGGVYERLGTRFSTIDGTPVVTFSPPHFSPYGIYADLTDLGGAGIDPTPKTGDGIHPKWFLVAGLVAMSMLLFMKKERRPRVSTA